AEVPLIRGGDEGPTELERRPQRAHERVAVSEQRMSVEPALAARRDDTVNVADTIGAHDLAARAMPGDEVNIVLVVAVDVAIAAGAFADFAKCDLPLAPQLAQSPGNLLRVREHHTHVADAREGLALRQTIDLGGEQACRRTRC